MIDRRSIRDVGLAVLLALPTAALTRPVAPDLNRHSAAAAPHVQIAFGDRSALRQRFILNG